MILTSSSWFLSRAKSFLVNEWKSFAITFQIYNSSLLMKRGQSPDTQIHGSVQPPWKRLPNSSCIGLKSSSMSLSRHTLVLRVHYEFLILMNWYVLSLVVINLSNRVRFATKNWRRLLKCWRRSRNVMLYCFVLLSFVSLINNVTSARKKSSKNWKRSRKRSLDVLLNKWAWLKRKSRQNVKTNSSSWSSFGE
jgi:hypothetical protein